MHKFLCFRQPWLMIGEIVDDFQWEMLMAGYVWSLVLNVRTETRVFVSDSVSEVIVVMSTFCWCISSSYPVTVHILEN